MRRQFILFLVAVAIVGTLYGTYRYAMQQYFESWCVSQGNQWDAEKSSCWIISTR